MNVSIYKHFRDSASTDQVDLEIFLDNIKTGYWQDQIIKVRAAKTKEEKAKYKSTLPSITTSGTFSYRKADNLIDHSGLLCIDIDDCDANEIKSLICADEYLYCAFTSAGGKGVAAIYKINPQRHIDAFFGLSRYLLKKYGIVIDQSCKDVSRLRAASWDPDIYINDRSRKFTDYIKTAQKTKIPKRKTIFVKNDFDAIVKQIVDSNIDLTSNYYDWMRIGFALNKHFGAAGEDYFHLISQQHPEYDHAKTSRKYKNLGTGDAVNLGTIYYLAKQAGIQTQSIQTKEIIQIASSHKRAGLSQEDSIQTFKEHTDYDIEDVKEIMPQVTKDTIAEDISMVEIVETEIRNNWPIKKNLITRCLEIKKNGKWERMQSKHFNTIFLTIKKNFEKTSFDLVERIIMSESTPEYNPLHEFFEKYKDRKPEGQINKLADTITSGVGIHGEDRRYFIKKWFVGMIGSVYGDHSPLLLCLCGKTQNTGKTEFWRRLMPPELERDYYGESKLDAGKDDEILMTQKLIIMDDEMGGKSKKDNVRLKELCSKDYFDLREPYGRNNVRLKRLSMLCGTTNHLEVLNDPTGNRRIIPINVTKINHSIYNEIDKIDLFMEAYHLFHSGFSSNMSKSDIELLGSQTSDFESTSLEEELFFKYFRTPTKENDQPRGYLTSEIKALIEKLSMQRLGINNLGAMLNKHLDKKKFMNDSGKRTMGWMVILKSEFGESTQDYLIDPESAPKSPNSTNQSNDYFFKTNDQNSKNDQNEENEEFTLF